MAHLIQLRAIRDRRGYSQTKLAELTGLARPYLSQLESGIKDGRVETLKLLAEVLGVTADDLIGTSVSENAPPGATREAK